MNNNNLKDALSCAVPIHIEELKKQGGPSDIDFKEISEFGSVLAAKGDVLLFGSKKKGEAADLFSRTAKALAVLSFLSGGVSLFGCHFETKIENK